MMTGLAISNVAPNPVSVSITSRRLSGASGPSGTMTIPARGQVSLFLNQIPGFTNYSTAGQGIVRIYDETGSIAVTGIRARINEQGDFLVAATPPVDQSDDSRQRLFPQIADGGGYSTQIVLINANPTQNATGTVRLFTQSGAPMSLTLR